MTMSTRRARIVVSLAGPIGGLTIGAICALVAAAEGGFVGGLAFKAASLFIFQFAFNMLPILELDGYFVLCDLLDAPFLRARAIAFARGIAVRKLRRRERWTASEMGLATYGALAIVTSLVMVVFSLGLWQSRVAAAAAELLRSGPAGLVAIALLVLVFIGPLLLALVARVIGWLRAFARASAERARRARMAALQERARVLARVPFLAGLNPPSLMAIASHLQEERTTAGAAVVALPFFKGLDPVELDRILPRLHTVRVPAGDAVVNEGDPGDRYYLIREGEAEVSIRGQATGRLGKGAGFGEIALLTGRPRTATVRAVTDLILAALGRREFIWLVKESGETMGQFRARTAHYVGAGLGEAVRGG